MAKTRRVKFEFNEHSLVSLKRLREQGAFVMSDSSDCSVPAPPILRAVREQWFRDALNRLLREHGAELEVTSNGGELDTSFIQVTMRGSWDGENNEIRQFAQFSL